MKYRKRLDRRHPEIYDTLAETANEVLTKYDSMSQLELAEYIRSEMKHPATDGIIGLISALEAISQGQMSSRPNGPTPINVVCAFGYWLYQHPEIEEAFRASDLFQELCDSGNPDFEWPDKFEDEPAPNVMLLQGGDTNINKSDDLPGNYL